MGEWISVESRLPEVGATCWIYDELNGVIDSRYIGLGNDFDDYGGFYSEEYCDPLAKIKSPTHWMLLKKPDAPSELPKYGEEGYTPRESEVPEVCELKNGMTIEGREKFEVLDLTFRALTQKEPGAPK